jgi:hypothetical protein
MRCLSIAGLGPIAKILQTFLLKDYPSSVPGRIPDITLLHWNTAVDDPLLELPLGRKPKSISTKAEVRPHDEWRAMYTSITGDYKISSIFEYCVNTNRQTRNHPAIMPMQISNDLIPRQLLSAPYSVPTNPRSAPNLHTDAPHIIQFYYNEISRNAGNHFFYSIFQANFKFEDWHDYIQFFFPSPVRSRSSPGAPLFDSISIGYFQSDPTLQKYMICVFIRMMDFYGLQIEFAGQRFRLYTPVPWTTESKIHECDPGNHNYLRLTRIMISLTFAGLKRIAYVLRTFLLETYVYLPRIRVSDETLQYWRDAVQERAATLGCPLTNTPDEFTHIANPKFQEQETKLKDKIKDPSLPDKLYNFAIPSSS